MTFRLRFPKSQVERLACCYSYPNEDLITRKIGPRSRQLGYLTKQDFLELCYWKTSRSRKHCATNSEELIRAVTRVALSTDCEELRIKAPQVLAGVGWPTASVILHFGYNNLYPIIDYRALWSLGMNNVPPHKYDFDFWWSYTQFCRELAGECRVTMRVLDRALWQFSKDNQH